MTSRKRLTIALAVFAVLILCATLVAVTALLPRRHGISGSDASSWARGVALPPETAKAHGVFVAANDRAPQAARVAAILNPMVEDNPLFAQFTGTVVDAYSGEMLWNYQPGHALQPASVMKLLTAQAALLSLPPDHRLVTETLLTHDGYVVLRGGGDVTLASAGVGQRTFYRDAPTISSLAARTQQEMLQKGITPRGVLVDVSLYHGSTMAEGWNSADIGGGSVAPMSPVMLDGARLNPALEDSPRSSAPAEQVGRALAHAMGLTEVAVIGNGHPATKNLTPLARVSSAPLLTRLHDMLIHSDNVLAESIGREIAVGQKKPATFQGATEAILTILRKHKIDVDQVTMKDSSGLSLDNRLTSAALAQVVRLSTQSTVSRFMMDDLPVSGGSGTLSYRFQGVDSDARGWVRAKTGTLSGASSLAGIIVNRAGRVLVFSFIMNGQPPHVARPALDILVTTLYNASSGVS